ncbi:pyocin S6 family toxin immunity protein [Pseudomonas sp. Irchel 3F6]|uniref:pyocin S6 family toxin immunity protein n=1 Tax=Pseudomonas sp. Irchel 3F6 TaxID=2009003 RepID=UPI003530826E
MKKWLSSLNQSPWMRWNPGELLLTQDQVTALENLLNVSFPKGLEYFMGTCATY